MTYDIKVHRITPEAVQWVVAFLRNSNTDIEITPDIAWLMHCACAIGADPYETAAAVSEGRVHRPGDLTELGSGLGSPLPK